MPVDGQITPKQYASFLDTLASHYQKGGNDLAFYNVAGRMNPSIFAMLNPESRNIYLNGLVRAPDSWLMDRWPEAFPKGYTGNGVTGEIIGNITVPYHEAVRQTQMPGGLSNLYDALNQE